MSLRLFSLSAVSALVLAAGPAIAHHSFAMFDRTKTDELSGVVKQFDMVNPHGWLHLTVSGPAGKTVEWSLETGGPGQLQREGFTQQSLKPGDKVTARIHPLRDGSNGGQLMSVTTADGHTFGAGGPPGRG